MVEVFPAPERPTRATVSPALMVRLRFVNIGALGRDWYVRFTFWKVMAPVDEDDLLTSLTSEVEG
jgi:hypothetical protein